jgi:hypothetical protein
MITLLQRILLVLGVLALLAVLINIGISIAATMLGATPAQIVHVQAGPYPLKVSLYRDPADAGYALPFAIAPEQAIKGTLQFAVSSLPGKGVDATPIRDSFSPDPMVANGIQGAVEITVQGRWHLHITVDGPAGHGVADVPVQVIAPLAFPGWSGWFIGCIPVAGLLIFLLIQSRNNFVGLPLKPVPTL